MSEFGHGYATCLRQFSNHRIRLVEFVANKMFSDDKMTAQMWTNGASDHLYDLVKPRRGVGNATWKKARFVQSEALAIGHGFARDSNPKECETLLDAADQLLWLTQTESLDEALAWDIDHGLKPDQGDYSCPLDIVRFGLNIVRFGQ